MLNTSNNTMTLKSLMNDSSNDNVNTNERLEDLLNDNGMLKQNNTNNQSTINEISKHSSDIYDW